MEKKSRLIRVTLLISMILCLILTTIIVIYAYLVGQWRFSYDVKITDFSVCDEISTIPNASVIEIDSDAINGNNNQINICGYLESDFPADFRLLVYKDSRKTPVSIVFHDIDSGNFSLKIPLSEEDITGTYKVEVERRRSVIATTEFIIINR